jgi:hypothetical protein
MEWQYYPRSRPLPDHLDAVLAVFAKADPQMASSTWDLSSNQALAVVTPGLTALGFKVESGTTRDSKVYVPVLFGRNGRVEKAFEVDGYSEELETVIEVEAGRAFTNNQFLKDFFEACVMPAVQFAVIAVRSQYRRSNDFAKVCAYFDSLFASDRLRLPLSGLLIIGY